MVEVGGNKDKLKTSCTEKEGSEALPEEDSKLQLQEGES